eukprot:gnl/TRDRNA2_/TRDRNA2_81361_c0_seq1.p1 gnl/TRDRNA2_/TRDRNA2_81361_c0~~gnl/TRDRNA2_/TRDRNA2_81361_c0_seq1.p1  ORF type:complete len:266 (-),score=36.79 gnl/TRDRNA2_/TRDRNA2_81361_c0_seq1:88-885(-)
MMRGRLCVGVLVLLLLLVLPVVQTLQGLRSNTEPQAKALDDASVLPASMFKAGFEARIKHDATLVTVSLLSNATRHGTEKLTLLQATNLLREDSASGDDFRNLLSDLLRKMPFKAYFWECPPMSRSTWQSNPFEFVVIDAPHLDSGHASSSAFSSYLSLHRGQPVVTKFSNLGGDAELVAPAQAGSDAEVYEHIGSFLRGAPDVQVQALWRGVGDAIKHRLEQSSPDEPTWVNTEGSGVPWLHVRLDSTPKYYHHTPYERWPVSG